MCTQSSMSSGVSAMMQSTCIPTSASSSYMFTCSSTGYITQTYATVNCMGASTPVTVTSTACMVNPHPVDTYDNDQAYVNNVCYAPAPTFSPTLSPSTPSGYWTHTYYSDALCTVVDHVQSSALGTCFSSFSSGTSYSMYVYSGLSGNTLSISVNTYSDSACTVVTATAPFSDTLNTCGALSSGTYPKSTYVSGSTAPSVPAGYATSRFVRKKNK